MAHPLRAPSDEALASLPLLSRALAHEGSLISRTEGLTWMLWGLVLSSIFLMYNGTGALFSDGTPPWWTYGLWVPWVLAGSVFTAVLWRSAALRVPLPRWGPAGALVTMAWLAAILLGFAILDAAPAFPDPESAPLAAVGLAWLAMAALNLFRASPTGRRIVLLIGATTLLAGIALALLWPPLGWSRVDADAARAVRGLARAVLAGAVPFVAGAWQASRG